MAKVGSVHCIGFLVEGTSACALVDEAGSCLLVGRCTSGGVFWGVCGLFMILGSLSANGWGFVPVFLVACLPYGVQHCSLLVIEWSWVLALRWRSLGDFRHLILHGAGRSLVDQYPELGSPTSEAQP